MLIQKDVTGITVLQYIAKLKMYRFLQINHVNRIVSSLWESKVDAGGSMFAFASSYYLTFENEIEFNEDNETRLRFYEPRDEKVLPHPMTFSVWKKSMSLRYLIETLLFFALMLVFQYEVSAFNKDLHISIEERSHFLQLEHEIVARGGLTYKDTHCEGCSHNSASASDHSSTGSDVSHVSSDSAHHRRYLAGGGEEYDFSSYTLEQLQEEEEEVHTILLEEFHLVRVELDVILYISTVAFLFPFIIICKYIFAQKTDRRFFFTGADFLDILVFLMIVWIWETVTVYEASAIKEELFGPPEDESLEVRFVDNVIYDIENDIFHLDYLMAAVTAVLWIRSIVLLRLTETFGPMLVMIYRMFLIVLVFLFIYFLGILTFSCIATLTLTTNPNFANLFEAGRTYVMASLGNFDLY